jgi:hypothetical protein
MHTPPTACLFLAAAAGLCVQPAVAQHGRPDVIFEIFQFPADHIPRIDGDPADWSMVPDRYVIGSDQLVNDEGDDPIDPRSLDVNVRVGWVKGMNRLYFLYEAYDDYWDFALPGLHNDTFEIVVDGDRSGGPLIDRFHPNREEMSPWETFYSFHGVHAQNYHVFTPAEGKDWALAWGSQPWIKELPYANAAASYDFEPGESGRLVLEFWITPFDYAGPEGPGRAVESLLYEGKAIGLSWAVLDYDDVDAPGKDGFWNLSRKHTMYGDASELALFRLMPLEPPFKKPLEAQWSFEVIDMDRRLVAFKDLSEGEITSWQWDFGDGTVSTEQHPLHQYEEAGQYVVVLYIEGPEGTARRAKVWDVALK